MELPDIARYIKNPNDGLKLNALTSLIQRLDRENNSATLKSNLEYLYEATQSPSSMIADSACKWLSKTITKVYLDDSEISNVLKEHFKDTHQVFTEIFSRIKKTQHPRFLGKLAFDLVHLQDEKDVNDPKNLFGFFQVFLRIYAVIPASIEEIITFNVQKPNDILRILHHNDLSSHLADWFIKKGFEQFSNKQALLECISSKISYRNLHLLTSQNGLNIFRFFFDNIELFLDLPDYSFKVPEGKYDLEVAEFLVTSSMDLIKLIKEKGFIQPSPILSVPLFALITSFNQLNRCLPNIDADDDGICMKDITSMFKECQNSLSLPEYNEQSFETITEWFAWIVKNHKIAAFLKQWKYLKESNSSLFVSVQSLLILFGFFPFVVEDGGTCDILFDVIRLSCNETNETLIINFHLCFFSTSSIQIKRKLLQNLSKIKLNDILTKQILRFYYTSSQHSDIFVDVYDAVGTIFKRHDWIFFENDFVLMIDIPRTQEAATIKQAKFKLIKLACLTESGEKIIPKAVAWIRDRPDLLTDAVQCISNLSSIEMIEIEKLRAMLKSRVRQPGNEAALAEYCHFLATSMIDFDEFDLAVSCAEELWALKDHESPNVRAAAYEALSKFSKFHLPETLVAEQQNPTAAPEFLSGEQVFQGIKNDTDATTLKGFGNFLKKALTIDVEQLSRKFFISHQSTGDSPLFIALIPVLRENLSQPGNEWKCLGLIEPLSRALMPASKKVTRCSQIIQCAFLKQPWTTSLSLYESLKHFVAVKNAVDTLFQNILETNQAVNKKLDCFDAVKSIISVFSQSIEQSSTGLSNSILGLLFLFKALQDHIINEAATNHLKQAFLQENLLIVGRFRRQFLDTFTKIIDEKWKNLEANDALSNVNEMDKTEDLKVLASFSGILLKFWSYNLFSQDEQAALAIFESYFETMDDGLITAFLKPLSSNYVGSEFGKLVQSLSHRQLPSNDSLSSINNDPKTLKLLCQFFDIDPILSQLVQEIIPSNLESETSFKNVLESQSINELWEAYFELSDSLQLKNAQQLSKKLEKIIKKDKTTGNLCLEYFADYCIIFHSGIKKKKIFSLDYSHLPEKSILRVSIEKARTNQNLCETVLQSIIDLKRADPDAAYHIPPLDWTSLNFHKIQNSKINQSLFIIGLQQSDLQLIYKFIKTTTLSFDDISAIEDKIAECLTSDLPSKIPVNAFIDLVTYLVEMFAANGWKSNGSIPKALCEVSEKRAEIRNVLARNFGSFESAAKLNSPYFQYFCHVKDIACLAEGNLGKYWIELCKKERTDISKLMQIMTHMDSKDRAEAFIVTVSWLRSIYQSETRLRLLKRLEQISSSSQIQSEQAFDIFAAIIIAEKNESFPLELLQEDSKEQKRYLLDFLPNKLKSIEWFETASKIVSNILSNEMVFPERKIALKCLRILINKYPAILGSISSSLLNEMFK
uniref:Uncharacterized protein n=1 Tax=Panagrolaimus sp. ES5 TaxID=591445 RepID=A0AC34F803_9BILA